jgi:hypothetical protein
VANVKLVVIYPRPKNVDVFENIYQSEHVPLTVAKLGGKTKMVATKILGSPQGVPPFYRVAEVLLSVDAGSGSVRRFGRREGSPGKRREDFFRGSPHLFGGRRRGLYIPAESK